MELKKGKRYALRFIARGGKEDWNATGAYIGVEKRGTTSGSGHGFGPYHVFQMTPGETYSTSTPERDVKEIA